MNVTRRAVQDSDEALLRALYATTRKFELNQVPFTPEQKQAFLAMQFDAQRKHYSANYPQGVHEVICADNNPVGRVWTAVLEDELRIMDITLLPEWRGRGVGAAVLRELIAQSEALSKPLRVWVEIWNPSQGIFQHLGFQAGNNDGVNVLFERKTEKATA